MGLLPILIKVNVAFIAPHQGQIHLNFTNGCKRGTHNQFTEKKITQVPRYELNCKPYSLIYNWCKSPRDIEEGKMSEDARMRY